MHITDISWLSLAIGFLSLLLPIYFFKHYDTKLNKETIISFARMTVQLFAVGIILKTVFTLNSIAINILWISGMLIAASMTIVRRTNLKQRYLLRPIGLSVLFNSLLNGLIFAFVLIGYKNFISAQYIIPIYGMIIGNTINNTVIGVRSFYKQFQSNEESYKYLLMAGASKKEALRLFISEALRDAFTPTIASTAVMGLIWLPGMMTGQILGGSSPVIAIKYQIMIMVSIFVGGVLNVVLAIRFSIKPAFDSYDMLKKDIYLNKKSK
jgi:putative ABC transport system permease protein